MKLHHVVAVLFLVVLTGAGFTLAVWQHSTLAHQAGLEEGANGETSHVGEAGNSSSETAPPHEVTTIAKGSIAGETNNNEQTSDGTPTTESSVTEAAANEDEQATALTSKNEQTTAPLHVETTTVAGTAVTFTVMATRQEEAKTPLVTITLIPSNKPLLLSGWRLADAIGVAGHVDHVYYFGELTLKAGDTLTIHSACGRDEGLLRYWCLSQPLSLLDSASKALFFLDANGDLALTCTPTAVDQDAVPYQCSSS